MARPGLYTLAGNQQRAQREGRAMGRHENYPESTTLRTQDVGPIADYVIYIYNIANMPHLVEQPPYFPKFRIPACPPGKKFAFTTIPAYINESINRAGTFEYFTQKADGRKYATCLLNPIALPTDKWEGQLTKWSAADGVVDQEGNNLNELGCFWSLTPPDDIEKLQEEINIFTDILVRKCESLILDAEGLYANEKTRSLIGPLHHFAMDYRNKQAIWHTPAFHMVMCPNCGEPVREGIPFHRNSMGEKCIIDLEKYKAHMLRQRAIEKELETGVEGVTIEKVETGSFSRPLNAEEVGDSPAPKTRKRKTA